MEPPRTPKSMIERDTDITATVLRERTKLGNFIRRRVHDQGDAEDILQDVFHEFVQAYRLPAPIEQVSAWLFRVARNRIIDRFRKRREQPLADMVDAADDVEYRLDLALPATDAGPEALYARSVLLEALQDALNELPADQRDVFVAHELEGRSFKELASESGVGVNTLLARKRYAVLHLRVRLQAVYDELDI
ncbi:MULTISPECIES: RNA polymerase sigma factor [Paraburkholderia]|jgi:RNA polymerase sigma factor (sigma-70 family)|uniref:Sigma-70 family RNA polymerase sigma factor n=1 Tax=Paraburkholderia madseniana TaxID=2599607 RepID=A0A6N6WIN1_9BURK|nr:MULTISPECIES: sigma-70 family RNA polymerase sigma factor [Paraburkholderia]KAE8760525.1 sigma-70 family RNA polymerase sigma factor [Paraburkholderia madseniana]MCX4151862.1 sigma-70 family RNA polymerase sigma factor [Paraburkholderia madseniana]MDN7154789.1 sigma-70 family RNA polymerase sigma factor [Paraburkholderia sp. WS6]MDQ6413672.1 sigma-70 family RNA polymerase sigma factor [Paraburkholderia madseniana]NPT64490.1 sigma-70 family RNA polymerase sigma factor [Paraburkholderia madse